MMIEETPHFRAGERRPRPKMTWDDWLAAVAFVVMMLVICIV